MSVAPTPAPTPSFGMQFAEQSVLSSLPGLDTLISNYHIDHPQNIVRHSRSVVDLVDLRTSPDEYWDNDGNATDPLYLPHCHVVGMLPFTPFHNASKAHLATYEEAAAMALALQHLNTADGSIIGELEDLQCSNMVFTLEFLDTHFLAGPAIEEVFEFSSRGENFEEEGLRPCSFVGAKRSAVTLPTALLTGNRGYVQVSGSATSFQLDEKDQYPLFARTVPSDMDNVIPMLEYFRDRLQVSHLAILTMNEPYGQSFGQSIQIQASTIAPDLRIHRINMNDGTKEGIIRALQEFKETKYRYVLAAVSTPEIHVDLLEQAVDMDLAGNGDYQWFFPESFFGTIEKNAFFDTDSKLRRAYRGVGIFSPTDVGERSDLHNLRRTSQSDYFNLTNPTKHDLFKEQMRRISQTPKDIGYLNRILPQWDEFSEDEDEWDEEESLTDDDTIVSITRAKFPSKPGNIVDEENRNPLIGGAGRGGNVPTRDSLGGFGYRFSDTFNNNFPFLYDGDFLDPIRYDSAAYAYDATILMGISACKAIQRGSGESFTGKTHFRQLRRTRFQGVTGEIVVDPITGSRTLNSTTFKLVNLVDELVYDLEGHARMRFNVIVTDVYEAGTWVSREPFIFNDGTTTVPVSLPPPNGDGNYILPGIRGVAWFFSFISMILGIGFVIWTYQNRNARVVRASQPFFLYLLCFGVILVASAGIPTSFDSNFAPKKACTRACSAAVWLLFMGVSVVFSSLFTKAYRINLIMRHAKKFRRVTITVAQTLRPMVVLLSMNVIILAVMTALSPPQFEIVSVVSSNDSFGRPRESYGQCSYQHQGWYFLALATLNGSILVSSVIQSWHARKLATEFSESRYVFLALTSTMIVMFVGAPVLILARDNPNAVLFLGSAINFVFCLNVLLLMFVPKILFRKEQKHTKETKVSGLAMPSTSSSKVGRMGTLGKKMPWIKPNKEKENDTEETPDGTSQISLEYNSEHTEDTEGSGERILTRKSARELARLVNRLKRQLDLKEEEIRILAQKYPEAESYASSPEKFRETAYQVQQVLISAEHDIAEESNDATPQDCKLSPSEEGEMNQCALRMCNDDEDTSDILPAVSDIENPSRVNDTLENDNVFSSTSQTRLSSDDVKDVFRSMDEMENAASTRNRLFHIPSGAALMGSQWTLQSISPCKESEMARTVTPPDRTSDRNDSQRESRNDELGLKSDSSGSSEDEVDEIHLVGQADNHHSNTLLSACTW